MSGFDMPAGRGVTFEQRGGWVVNALARKYGLTLNQAAGIVGNAGYESAGFKILQEIKPLFAGSRGGTGWCQWTAERRRAFEAWCRARGLKVSSDEANFGFLCIEMEGSHAYCVTHLRKETTLDRCVFVWGRYFEVPGGASDTFLPGLEDRLKYARRALAGAIAAPASVPPIPTPTPAPKPAGDEEAEAAALNRAQIDDSDETAALNRAELERITRR